MSKYQYPHSSPREKVFLAKMGKHYFWEWLFAIKKLRKFYIASFKRALRILTEKYSHIEFHGHMNLPDGFKYSEEFALPRGNEIDGHYYSSGYGLEFSELPPDIQQLVFSFYNILESYFACEVNVNQPQLWRNKHIPEAISGLEGEVFSDAFHQDLVVDQYNIQLFILLHDTTESHGPFEYLDGKSQGKEMDYYRKRNRKIPKSSSVKLVGKRGDYMLFSTGMTLHKAGIPEEGNIRDIFSIGFFPAYTNIGTPMTELMKEFSIKDRTELVI